MSDTGFRLEKCSECDRVYTRDIKNGKYNPYWRNEQICDQCHANLLRQLKEQQGSIG